MSTTRITSAAKSGSLYESKVSIINNQLVIEKPDGTDLCRTTMSDAEKQTLADQLDPEPVPPPPPPPPPTSTSNAGKVLAYRKFKSDFDDEVRAANAAPATEGKWWSDRLNRVMCWSNSLTKEAVKTWLPKSWIYRDGMVASYVGQGDAPASHYVLDETGQRMLLRFKSNQYLADVGDSAFRTNFINALKSDAALWGSKHGVMIDDANFELLAVIKKLNGSTLDMYPQNKRTGKTYTQAEWQKDYADFIIMIKDALPNSEIVMNSVYYHAGGLSTNPDIQRTLKKIDGWYFERGFGDTGVQSTGGKWGWETIAQHIKFCHDNGTFVVHDIQSDAYSKEYVRNSYLLFNQGEDHIQSEATNGGMERNSWWTGWQLDLGKALENVQHTTGTTKWTRRFEQGTITVDSAAHSTNIT